MKADKFFDEVRAEPVLVPCRQQGNEGIRGRWVRDHEHIDRSEDLASRQVSRTWNVDAPVLWVVDEILIEP